MAPHFFCFMFLLHIKRGIHLCTMIMIACMSLIFGIPDHEAIFHVLDPTDHDISYCLYDFSALNLHTSMGCIDWHEDEIV
jgi:hypothetical protein